MKEKTKGKSLFFCISLGKIAFQAEKRMHASQHVDVENICS